MRFIATGACSEAAKLLRHEDRSVEDMDIGDAFNYGMAAWGATDKIVRDPFVRVVELDQSESEMESDPNYLQCMAVASWATGDTPAAAEFEARAREAVRGSAFSCWRYAEVPANKFKEDLDDIRALIDGDDSRMPRFVRSKSMARTSG